jgi:hypothetical protein
MQLKTFRSVFALFVSVCLLVTSISGCSVLMKESHSLVATFQANSSSPARFITTLSMRTRYIEFDGLQNAPENQRVRITAANHGRSPFEIRRLDGKFVLIPPGDYID